MDLADVNFDFSHNFVAGHTCTVTHVPSMITTSATSMDRREARDRALKALKAKVMIWERKYGGVD